MRHLRVLLFLLPFAFLAKNLPAQTPLRNLVCINVKPQDPFISRMNRFGLSRGFHLFADDIAANNGGQCPPASGFPQKIRWNPSRNGNKFIDYDDFYGEMPQRTLAVLHGNAPFMSGGLFGKPICPSDYPTLSNHEAPQSYLINSIRASLFASRYGSAGAGFPSGFDAIAGRYVETPDNQFNGGNGTVRFVEIFNEADNAWSDGLSTENTVLTPGFVTQYYCSPAQYAAMLSAAYDGNCDDAAFQINDNNGSPVAGAFWGIKNLSPGTQVVMAGTADLRGDWISEMVDHSATIRSCNDVPFDIVNYHFYSTTGHPHWNTTPDWNYYYEGKKFFPSNTGTFPEASNIQLKERFALILNGQHPAIQNLPVWITEFGFSAAGASFGAFDAPTVQGQWLTRYILETSASRDANNRGIERLFIYELNDDLNTPGFTYHGLQKSDGTPKKAWYHVMTMLNVLGDRWYLRNNASGVEQYFLDAAPNVALPVDDPRIYLFGTGATTAASRTYAAWVPTGQDLRYPGKLRIEGDWTGKPNVP